ncbi:MAG: TlpA family protein disulfide reductase [Saprospiraceae bacterium]|nr:TlpA family protein disulfide reductase [Saprospiraceae bacterium]
MKKILFAAFILGFVGLLHGQTALSTPPQYKSWDTPPAQFPQPNEVNKTFPFAIALKDTTGTIYNSADVLKTDDKPLVLMFWLTTCGPCKMELEAYKANYDKWKQEVDFRIIAISTDFPQNAENYVKRTKQAEWQFESYHDYQRHFGMVMPGELNGLPQVFILDNAGNITYHHRRFIPGDEVELFTKIKETSLQMKSAKNKTQETKGE